jgi:hypothetical protein
MMSEFLQSSILVTSEVEVDDIGQGQRKANRRHHDCQDSIRELIGRMTKLVKSRNNFVVFNASLRLVEEGRDSTEETIELYFD